MVSIRKRGAVYGVIGLMLCVAVYLNWSYFQSPSELTVATQTENTSEGVYGAVTSVNADSSGVQSKKEDSKTTKSKTTTGTTKDGAAASADAKSAAAASSDDAFSQARLKRQTARDEALSILKETASSKDASESTKEDVTKQISVIAANAVKESKIESRIQGKGYSDAVVMIEDGSISATVASKEGKLSETDVAKIADIIVAETGADLSTIKISDVA